MEHQINARTTGQPQVGGERYNRNRRAGQEEAEAEQSPPTAEEIHSQSSLEWCVRPTIGHGPRTLRAGIERGDGVAVLAKIRVRVTNICQRLVFNMAHYRAQTMLIRFTTL